jgi:ferredoxin
LLVVLVDRDHLLGRSRSDPTPEIAGVGIPFPIPSARDCRVSPEIAAFIRDMASLALKPSSQERVTVMKVWIDQDLCTGDGLCEEIAPDVFTLLDDGLAYVKEGDKIFSDPGGAEGLANVPAGQEEATIEAAEECPGECIFIEVD